MSTKQWVVTVVAEGETNPFDIVSDFMEDLRIRGDYDVVSYAVTPTSGICANSGKHYDNDSAIEYDNDGYNSAYPDIPTTGAKILDGNDRDTYAGFVRRH